MRRQSQREAVRVSVEISTDTSAMLFRVRMDSNTDARGWAKEWEEVYGRLAFIERADMEILEHFMAALGDLVSGRWASKEGLRRGFRAKDVFSLPLPDIFDS